MPPLSCLTVRSHQPWQHGDEAIEYERLTWFPPECTESVRNWPGSNSNGSAPTPSTGASRNVLTLGVSWKTRATRSLPTQPPMVDTGARACGSPSAGTPGDTDAAGPAPHRNEAQRRGRRHRCPGAQRGEDRIRASGSRHVHPGGQQRKASSNAIVK